MVTYDEWLDTMPSLNRIYNLAKKGGYTVYPEKEQVYRAIDLCPTDSTRVVILGQDPYPHDAADGLAFSNSSPKERAQRAATMLPASLTNIFEELWHQTGIENRDTSGKLDSWAKQGVLLLNTALTVPSDPDVDHKEIWEECIDTYIQFLSDNCDTLIFVLWGAKAKAKKKYIDEDKHHILTSGHPSPLSVKYFEKNNHFIKINNILVETLQDDPIDWRLNNG